MTSFSDLYELSPVQQEILLHCVSFPASRLYLRQIRLDFAGDLDAAAFRRAWQAAVDRHPVLRTGFLWGAVDKPLQVVYREAELPFAGHDLRDLPEPEQERRSDALLAEVRERYFDLARPPLLSLALLRLGDRSWRLAWTYHHLMLDGWSLSILLGEVLAGTTSDIELPPAPPFRAFIEWLQSREMAGSEAFWRGILAGFTAPTPLPGERQRLPGRGEGGVRRESEIRLAPAAAERLMAAARRHRLTLNTIAEGAWAVLLGRYSGERDVLFGITVTGRPAFLEGADAMVGLFVNTVPARQSLAPAAPAAGWLRGLQEGRLEQRLHEHCAPSLLRGWSQVPRSLPLYESLLVFENYPVAGAAPAASGLRLTAVSSASEATAFPLTLLVVPGAGISLRLGWDPARFEPTLAARLLEHAGNLFAAFLEEPARPLCELPWWSEAEGHQMLREERIPAPGEGGGAAPPASRAIMDRAALRPAETALVCAGRTLSWGELARRVDGLAARLRELGVGPEVRVGVSLERGFAMVTSLVAVLAAGGAYVPLDPDYPRSYRVDVLADAAPRVVVTRRHLAADLPLAGLLLVFLDDDGETAGLEGGVAPAGPEAGPDHLAYVIYTSGSTGRPKGVEICRRGLDALLPALDERFGTGPGTWLAVTSICFDISVVELLWALSRGFTVVLQTDLRIRGEGAGAARGRAPVDLSLFYFSSLAAEGAGDPYRLLLEGARWADRNGFAAVWTPERHFHPLGGPFPNPAVAGAAVAQVTERIEIRAGSVVLPLHPPLRVAEEWAMVDNLSHGRVGLAFAPGWHAQDFVLAPELYRERRQHLLRGLDTVRRLWRGETVRLPDGTGQMAEVRTYPRPVRRDLPVWLSTPGDPEVFRQAAAADAGVLTHLFDQSPKELGEKIALYRQARRQLGQTGPGRVCVMVHTFLGRDLEAVRERVRRPFCEYLRTSLGLLGGMARSLGKTVSPADLTEDDLDVLLGHAFDRYFAVNSFLGTPETCRDLLAQLAAAGVDEIACFIDFGLDTAAVLESLELLREVRDGLTVSESPVSLITRQIREQGVTHLQCTPSLAGILCRSPEAAQALGSLRLLVMAGEALPPPLATRLTATGVADLQNAYGPTEATVFMVTERVEGTGEPLPRVAIGRPLRGSYALILDRDLTPVPRGAAGDLHIGGPGLARGYLGRPDVTAEKFVPDPWSEVPGARLYRTGDLARQLSDGRLDFLERLDRQVKVRGHRIELGEVEAALGSHPGVRECLLVARPDEMAGRRLVAYFVPAGEPPDARELRGFLRQRLPEPLLPSAFVPLPAFPLRPNGKVDAAALADPEVGVAGAAPAWAAPGSEVERTIAAIWRALLQVDEVGLDDNFFELGGNSLLLFEVHRRLTDEAGLAVEMADLLRLPTVRSLAHHLAFRQPAVEVPLAASRERAEARLAARGRRGTIRELREDAGHV